MAELIQIANGVAAIRFGLSKQVTTIGRSADSDICLSDSYVSKEHAVIEARESDTHPGCVDFYLHDLGSTNFSYLNKERVQHERLTDKDILLIGRNHFRFICTGEEVIEGLEHDVDTTVEMDNTNSDKSEASFSRRLFTTY
jgi:pSer/pThr/pTyr-binding forkhead associated (FHA) protein